MRVGYRVVNRKELEADEKAQRKQKRTMQIQRIKNFATPKCFSAQRKSESGPTNASSVTGPPSKREYAALPDGRYAVFEQEMPSFESPRQLGYRTTHSSIGPDGTIVTATALPQEEAMPAQHAQASPQVSAFGFELEPESVHGAHSLHNATLRAGHFPVVDTVPFYNFGEGFDAFERVTHRPAPARVPEIVEASSARNLVRVEQASMRRPSIAASMEAEFCWLEECPEVPWLGDRQDSKTTSLRGGEGKSGPAAGVGGEKWW